MNFFFNSTQILWNIILKVWWVSFLDIHRSVHAIGPVQSYSMIQGFMFTLHETHLHMTFFCSYFGECQKNENIS